MPSASRITLFSCLILLAGCSDLPADGTTAQANPTDGTEELTAALVDTAWHWAYYTAALGGDYDTWLTFDAGGSARWTREFWIHDYAGGTSSFPVESVVGQYTMRPFNRVDVEFEETNPVGDALDKANAPKRFHFTGAVSQTLPRLSFVDGQEVLTADGRGFTTRAFASIGNKQWRSEYGETDAQGHFDAVVTATIDFDAPECSLVLRLSLQREDDETTKTADETTPAIPCRFETVPEGTFAIADSLRYHDDRAKLLEELGATERHGDALYYKLTEAMQFLYFRADATPNLLLPNGRNIVEDAWWTPGTPPPTDPESVSCVE